VKKKAKTSFLFLISISNLIHFFKKQQMFNIPNLLTSLNLLSGVLAIILSLFGRIDIAPYLIFLGAIFDFFDGFAARLLKKSGELGKQLDSLADMITFGLAPGVFMFVILIFSINKPIDIGLDFSSHIRYLIQNWVSIVFYDVPNTIFTNLLYIPFTALIIPFFSMFRLAKFNIDTRQTESFIGLATPANTIFFSTFPLALSLNYQNYFQTKWMQLIYSPEFIVPLIGIMSLLLIAEIPMFSFKFKTFKWKGNQLRISFLLTSLILIITLLVWSIPIIVFLYIILSFIENNTKAKKNEI